MSEKLTGRIEKVIFSNESNGYTVALFKIKHRSIATKRLGNVITIVGYFDRSVYIDEEFVLEGEVKTHKTYGTQFAFTSFMRPEIKNEEAIITYLSSDLFPSVGLINAKKIVDALGASALSIIQEDPSSLDKIEVSETIKKAVIEGIKKDLGNKETILFLLKHGITIDMANKIVSQIDGDIIEKLTKNPYLLMDKVDGFRFQKADDFALKLGIERNSILRIKALVSYLVKYRIFSTGNSYTTKDEIKKAIYNYNKEYIDDELFAKVLTTLSLEQKIIIKENNIFDALMYKQETDLAKEIIKLIKGERNENKKMKSFALEEIDHILQKIQKESSISFNEEQLEAIRLSFTEPVVIITGGPGTGKTTIVHAIIKMYLELNKNSTSSISHIALLAPTGRAAKRLYETTKMEAQTIHRFLGYSGGEIFEHSRENPTNARLVIVDEASMMDLPLAYRLITSLHKDARLIIVGDVDQLPSVGPGQVLYDLIASKEITTVRLNKILRQAADSNIISLAHAINEGFLPENILDTFSDRTFIKSDNSHLLKLVEDLVVKSIQKGKSITKDIQILAPRYLTDVGIDEINKRIQNVVNPLEENLEITKNKMSFRKNDKVIQLVNRAELGVMNGDIGIVTSIKTSLGKPKGLVVTFDTTLVEYDLEMLDDLSLAYAISIHKAQGSEFDIVILPISSYYQIMLHRKLIYTAITRAKKVLMLVGDVNLLARSASNLGVSRKTILKDEIIKNLSKNKNLELRKIDDEKSAFDTLGEVECDFSPSDFEDL